MKTFSIRTKLSVLCGFLIALVVGIGVQGLRGIEKVALQLDDVAETQLPAVRNMTLADMMHDGLRATVFRALFWTESQDPETKKEIEGDLKEASEKIISYVQAIDHLNIHPETKTAIADSQAEIKAYVQSAEEIVGLCLAGKKGPAVAKIESFQKAFSVLEKKLEHLGGLIEKDSEESGKAGRLITQTTRTFTLILLAIGLLVGTLSSVLLVRSLLKTLNSLVTDLSGTSDQVASTATQIASTSERLSQSSTEQAASLEETAASLEQITAMIAKASDGAESAATSSNESQQKAEEGRTAVDQMLSAMNEISHSNEAIMNQVNDSNRQMSEIVKVIQDIGTKTKVINEIVFQTKLLSFNASVEAARAGEHGKGFAVVAEEVGNLAQMSGNAAKEISDMLDGSISRVENIVRESKHKVETLIREGKEKVSAGIEVANQCSSYLGEIVDNVSKVTNLSQEISQASKEQSQGVSEINKAMSQLDTVTQQNASTSEESAASARELAMQTDALQKMVDDIKSVIGGSRPSTTHSGTAEAATYNQKHNEDESPAEAA